MSAFIMLLALAAVLGCVPNLRSATTTLVLVGFLQDPLRKLIPGEPVYMTASIVLFLLVAFVAALLRGETLGMQGIVSWRRTLRRPVLFMLLVVLAQCVHTLVVTGNPVIPMIGLISYLTPVPAVIFGIRVLGSPTGVRRALVLYVAIAAMLSVSVMLGFLGYESRLLESVGSGVFIYSSAGAHELQTGFMRATEVAAWHIGAGVAFAIMLIAPKRLRLASILPTCAFSVWMLATIFMTGRRKILIGLLLFAVVYALVLRFLAGSKRGSGVLFLVLAIGSVLVFTLPDMGMFQSEAGAAYLERTTSGEGFERLGALAGELSRVLSGGGLLGMGAGLGAQGSQHYGGGVGIVGGSAESGPGRIAAELGILGLIGLVWVGVAVARECRAILRTLAAVDRERAAIVAGFVSFLAMNVAIFLVYHQVFGDPFVLTMIGFVVGGLLGLSRVAGTARLSVAPALAPPATAPLVARVGGRS
jgi:hypothetical protein